MPYFKAFINEIYRYFLSPYDLHTEVDMISILANP